MEIRVGIPDEVVKELADEIVKMLGETVHYEPVAARWFTVNEAAERLRCQPQRIYDLVNEGKLRPARDGRRLLFRREWLDDYLTR